MLDSLVLLVCVLLSYVIIQSSAVVISRHLEAQGRLRSRTSSRIWTMVIFFSGAGLVSLWEPHDSPIEGVSAQALEGPLLLALAIVLSVAGIGVVRAMPPRRRAGPAASSNQRWSRALRLAGLLLFVVSCIAPLAYWSIGLGVVRTLLLGVATLVLGALARGWLLEVASRLSAPQLQSEASMDGYVLYLRPFDDEHRLFAADMTLEEYLHEEVESRIGPLVALGNPSDRIAPKGATRAYLEDLEWQSAVERLAVGATAILTVATSSQSTSWELRRILDLGLQTRLFVFTSHGPKSSKPYKQRSIHAGWSWLWSFVKAWGRNDDLALADMLSFGRPQGSRSALSDHYSWESYVAVLRSSGYSVDDAEPGAAAVVAFDESGRAEVISRSAGTAGALLDAVERHLGAS